MRSVVADANVFVSFFVERNKAQQEAARCSTPRRKRDRRRHSPVHHLRDRVRPAEPIRLTSRQAATVVDAVTKFPGMQIVDDCPWKRVLELGPIPFPASPTPRSSPSPPTTDTTPSRPSTASSRTSCKPSASPRIFERGSHADQQQIARRRKA